MVSQEISLIKAENDAKGYNSEIEVTSFNSLLMHFVDEHKAKFVIRGLRAVSDFEYEFQMVGMNARLNPDVETLFLMSSERHQFISSRLVKEIAILGGEIDDFVSSRVKERMLVNIKKK